MPCHAVFVASFMVAVSFKSERRRLYPGRSWSGGRIKLQLQKAKPGGQTGTASISLNHRIVEAIVLLEALYCLLDPLACLWVRSVPVLRLAPREGIRTHLGVQAQCLGEVPHSLTLVVLSLVELTQEEVHERVVRREVP